jgi:hypothetical protein
MDDDRRTEFPLGSSVFARVRTTMVAKHGGMGSVKG